MILCTGEALIDMVPQSGMYRPLPGGAVYNTAIALGRLGAETGFLWPLSDDPFGAMLKQGLMASGVDATLCPQTARPTTLAFVELSDSGEARYHFYDEGSAGRMFSPCDVPDLDRVEALFCGGISVVPDPCGATVEALVTSSEAPVMIDPNIRPFFIQDAVAYRARLQRMIAQADLVKVSGDDLDWLCQGQDHDTAARQLLDQGAGVVFLTAGSRGVRVFWRGGVIEVAAPTTKVVDTIGAGDTFNAGVLASLQLGGWLDRARSATITETALKEAATLGVRAAAVTVSRAGANPPWAQEMAVPQ